MNDNGHGLACVMCSTERNRSNKRSEKRRRRTATTMPVLLSSTVDKSIGASPSSSLEVSHELCASKRCKVEGPLPSNNGVTSSGDLDFVSMKIPNDNVASAAARVSLDSSVNDDNDHRHRSIAVCFIDGDDAAAPSASENAFDSIKDGHDYGSAEEKSINIKKSPDVCYMCGSDLSHFGLKSRVAHVKRCTSKSGSNLFGGGSIQCIHDDIDPTSMDNEFHNMLDQNNDDDRGSKWHGDDDSRMTSDIIANEEPAKEVHHKMISKQQTSLSQFFEAPVRTLTSVLMAGARQVAKRNAIVASSKQSSSIAASSTITTTTMKSSKSRWRSNWTSSSGSTNNADNRRNGNCPSYKRITGTDFICDGFYYACTALSGNYFLTHFHSDVSGDFVN